MKPLAVSVVVCTRNRLESLCACLASLEKQTAPTIEIVVVDSSDVPLFFVSTFRDHFPLGTSSGIARVYRHCRPGLTHQRNIGAQIARGDVVHFLDDDVILEPNYIKEMQRIFAGHRAYGGGMGTVTNVPLSSGYFGRVLRSLFFIQRTHAHGMFTCSGMPTHAYGTTTFKDVEALGGCCCAYRRDVLAHHRFDENLVRYAYMEDCDFSKRVSRTCKLFFNPYARLAHHQSPIAREHTCDARAMMVRNYTYLFFKNFYPEKRVRVVAYIWTMLAIFGDSCLRTLARCDLSYVRGFWHGIVEYRRQQPFLLRKE